MTPNLLTTLQSIDPAVIAALASQALAAPALALGEWSVKPLAHEKVIETTGGLYRFAGRGFDGAVERTWSVVLKIIQDPGEGSPAPDDLDYWRRELLAYTSGMLANLPGGIHAARCYGVSEHPHDAWIWLEDVQETSGRVWSLADFHTAARCLGRFAGAYQTGVPLPNYPWLCRSLLGSKMSDGSWWARFINPASPNNAWQRPAVQALFPEPRRSQVLQIWADKWEFLTANERLPQVLCHNDAHRRNFMLRPDPTGQEALVVIDWGFCGPGGLGNDLGQMIGTGLSQFDADPADALEFETAIVTGYLAGLGDAGWEGDERLVRLGYTISLALYWGATLPCAVVQLVESSVNGEARSGRPVQTVLSGWHTLAALCLDRADEARYWIKRLT